MPPVNEQPTLPEWKELYAAAVEFKKINAWEWMYDSDIFGVQNPENGEIGYCSIMGALGELFALAVYLGTEGLETYRKLQTGKIKGDEVLFTQKCLMASFENRELLHPQDRKVIKDLGLKFRGRQAWPVFRSYLPGYYPWYLTKEEANFLTPALRQAGEVALMMKNDIDLLESVKKGHYLVRVPHSGGQGLVWETEYLKPPAPRKKPQGKEPAEPLDELRLQRLKRKDHVPGMIWEADLFMAPMPVREGEERPFFPRMSLFADHRSGFIFGSNVFPNSDYRPAFLKQFYDMLDATDALPEQLWVSNKETHELIKAICNKLEIEPRLVKKLRALEEAKFSLLEHMSQW